MKVARSSLLSGVNTMKLLPTKTLIDLSRRAPAILMVGIILVAITGVASAGSDEPTVCPGDLNGNNEIDGSDLAIVLGGWGPCPGCLADINDSSTVDGSDLAIVLGGWGACPDDEGTPTCDELSWLLTFVLPGIDDDVNALAVFDDGSGRGSALYAGGRFTSAGGSTVNYIARWDAIARTWIPLGSGMNGAVNALAVFDDGSGDGPALYSAGEFTVAGGVPANRIAKWNPATGVWSPLGTGTNNSIYALLVFDDGSVSGPALYAGGAFSTAGGATANGIAKWNSATGTWSALGSGLIAGAVRAMTVFDSGSGEGPALYVGGQFLFAFPVGPVNRIAKWNAASGTWSALGSGIGGTSVNALAVFDDGSGDGPELYAGGSFASAGGVPAENLAKWNADTGTWSPLSLGFFIDMEDGSVNALTVFDNGSVDGPALYVGGDFRVYVPEVMGYMGQNIATWPPSSSLMPGANNTVKAFVDFDDGSARDPVLFVGGEFTSVGPYLLLPASRIAMWRQGWEQLGSGLTAPVQALTVFDDNTGGDSALYATGWFTRASDVMVNRIAKWIPATRSWSALGSGLNSVGYALEVYDDGSGDGPALYVGGLFTFAGGVSANRIAKWNGVEWSPLGTGMNGVVNALAVFDDGSGPALFAGGEFTSAGGVAANRIAKWNAMTQTWSALGSGLNERVYALEVYDDGTGDGPALYAAGWFTSAGGVTANNIAKWNAVTGTWSAVGTGLSGTVRALKVFDDGAGDGPALYAGGFFTSAGGVTANNIAKWNSASGTWSPLGSGLSNWVNALAVFDDGSEGGPALYAGGAILIAGTPALPIAKWSVAEDTWLPVGYGMSSQVHALRVFNDGSGGGNGLYAGGEFTNSPAGDSYLAKWACPGDPPAPPSNE